MTTVTDVPRPQAVKGVRAALVVTVSASAMAGVIHAVAAREHDGDQLLLWMFALCAVAQVVWAAVVAVRPTRSVLIAGVVINGGAVLVWALTRTVGIPFIDSLSQVEPAGTQDFACALFAAASVGGAVRMLARPNVRVVITPVWASALAVMALLATVPALRAQHTYQHSGHTSLEAAGHLHGTDDATHLHDAVDHAAHSADDPSHAHDDTATGTEGHDHSTDSGSTAHAHVAGTTDGTSHDHTTTDGTVHTDHPTGTDGSHDHPTDPTDPTDPGHEHPVDPGDPTGPIVSLADPRLTAAQVAVATGLIDGVTSALAVYPDVAAVEAAGYVSLGDGGVDGFEHYIKWSYLYDGIEMNPAKIESIVVQKSVTGPKTIVSGMYILNLGKTMADAPDLAGSLTTFHYHDDLCLQGTTLVGLAVNGVCASGVLTVTPPMLHVWLIPQPCGPFAGIEGFGEDCGLHEH